MVAADHDGGVHPVGVPSCGTGPAGRMRFVAAELNDLWGELRGGRRRPARQRRDTAVHTIEPVGEPPVTEKGV